MSRDQVGEPQFRCFVPAPRFGDDRLMHQFIDLVLQRGLPLGSEERAMSQISRSRMRRLGIRRGLM